MLKAFLQGIGRNWKSVLLYLVLGSALVGFGYWLGQRSNSQESAGYRLAEAYLSHSDLTIPHVSTPPPPSPEMKEFVQNRMILAQKSDEFHRQGGTDAQFQQQNADLLKRQVQLAQIISQQQAANPPPDPPPLQIPPNASPQLRDFLTERDQLMRDQLAFMRQHKADDSATRQAAMQKWVQDNSSRIKHIRELRQALAQNVPPPSTSAPPPSGKSN